MYDNDQFKDNYIKSANIRLEPSRYRSPTGAEYFTRTVSRALSNKTSSSDDYQKINHTDYIIVEKGAGKEYCYGSFRLTHYKFL